MTVSGHESDFEKARLAVLIPCRNEAATVAGVVSDFKEALPGAAIFDTVTLGRREMKRLNYLGVPRFRGRRIFRATDTPERPPVLEQ